MARFELPTGLTDELINAAYPAAALSQLNAAIAQSLAAEPALATGSARGPLTRWCGYVFGNPRMTRPIAEALLPIQPGDPNPFFQAMDSMTQEGSEIHRAQEATGMASITGVTREAWLTLPRLALLVAAGGDAYHEDEDSHNRLYWFAKIDDPSEVLPVWWDPEGVKTWGDLPNPTTVDGGDQYALIVPNGQSFFPASLIVSLWESGRTLKTNEEIQAMMPQPQIL